MTCCTRELTVAVVICTNPHKIKPVKNSNIEGGRTPKSPTAADELLSTNGGRLIFLGVWAVAESSCPSGLPHTVHL